MGKVAGINGNEHEGTSDVRAFGEGDGRRGLAPSSTTCSTDDEYLLCAGNSDTLEDKNQRAAASADEAVTRWQWTQPCTQWWL